MAKKSGVRFPTGGGRGGAQNGVRGGRVGGGRLPTGGGKEGGRRVGGGGRRFLFGAAAAVVVSMVVVLSYKDELGGHLFGASKLVLPAAWLRDGGRGEVLDFMNKRKEEDRNDDDDDDLEPIGGLKNESGDEGVDIKHNEEGLGAEFKKDDEDEDETIGLKSQAGGGGGGDDDDASAVTEWLRPEGEDDFESIKDEENGQGLSFKKGGVRGGEEEEEEAKGFPNDEKKKAVRSMTAAAAAGGGGADQIGFVEGQDFKGAKNEEEAIGFPQDGEKKTLRSTGGEMSRVLFPVAAPSISAEEYAGGRLRSLKSKSTSCDSSDDRSVEEIRAEYFCDDDELRKVYNPCLENCYYGKELGEKCHSDFDCYSGVCLDMDTETSSKSSKNHKRCACVDAASCNGCSSDGRAVCARLEQPDPYVQLGVCSVNIETPPLKKSTSKSGKPKKIRSFSFGGGAIGDDPGGSIKSFTDNFKDVMSGKGAKDNTCPIISIFDDNGIVEPLLPPSFFQWSIDTLVPEDIGSIEIEGQTPEAIMNSFLFINDKWVKTIASDAWITTSSTSSSDDEGSTDIEVQFWPRVEAIDMNDLLFKISQETGKMYELVVAAGTNITLNFDIPEGVGIEFIGERLDLEQDYGEVVVKGDLKNLGRLSFDSLTVDFGEGSLDGRYGSTIIQHSEVINIARCPPRFQAIGNDYCFFATPTPRRANAAVSACEFFSDGNVSQANIADLEDAIISEVSDMFIPSPMGRLWVGNGMDSQCYSLDKLGNTITENICSQYYPVLCSVPIRKSIVGSNYGNYFSNFIVDNSEELFLRLQNPSQLPIQLGGKVTVYQGDFPLEDGAEGIKSFKVSDERPKAINVAVILKSGSHNSVSVALDTFDGVLNATEGLVWPFTDDSKLPSRVQVHATAPVCVERLDLKLRNETGHDHIALSIPATIFEDCLDFNVCTSSTEGLCGRSLMHYDQEQKCAILRTDDPKYPRDLSLNIHKSSCSRLTTWNHPSLGEPVFLEFISSREIQAPILSDGRRQLPGKKRKEKSKSTRSPSSEPTGSAQPSLSPSTSPSEDPLDPIEVKEKVGERNMFYFSGGVEQRVVDESATLPTEFQMQLYSGTGDTASASTFPGITRRVEQIRVKRYDHTLSGANFVDLWDCINVCSNHADEGGLLMAKINTVYLSLLEEIECRRLEELIVPGNQTGREACTTPPISVNSLRDVVQEELEKLENQTSNYRTLKVSFLSGELDGDDGSSNSPSSTGACNVPIEERTPDLNHLALTINRGLYMESGSTERASLAEIKFEVPGMAELTLDSFSLKDGSKIVVDEDGLCEISDSIISHNNDDTIFLENKGEAEVSSTQLLNNAMLENKDMGTLDLSFVEFKDSSMVVNSESGSLFVTRLTVHDDFAVLTTIAGIELPDANRIYVTEGANDPRCMGTELSTPSNAVEIDRQDGMTCEDLCEKKFNCKGAWTYFDVPEGPEPLMEKCVLCTDDVECVFNCASAPGVYKIPESKFEYTKVNTCAVDERQLKTIAGGTFEECKLLCSYYKSCEGFTVEDSTCQLIADLDFGSSCDGDDLQDFYIPYMKNSTKGFVAIQETGRLTTNAPSTSLFPSGSPSLSPSASPSLSLLPSTLPSLSISPSESEVELLDISRNRKLEPIMNSRGVLNEMVANRTGSFPNLAVDECSAVCEKTLSCLSFIITNENECGLYDSKRYFFLDGDDSIVAIYVSVRDFFPLKRYMEVRGQIESTESYRGWNTKTEERCKARCDDDFSCVAFHFSGFDNHEDDNCFLYKRAAVVNSLFRDQDQADSTDQQMVQLAFATETFVQPSTSLREFITKRVYNNRLLDECKSLCLYDKDCSAIRHFARTLDCVIGSLGDVNEASGSDYLVLEGRNFDIRSRYLSAFSCFSGEKIEFETQMSPEPESTDGYKIFRRACVDPVGMDGTESGSPSQCGLKCDSMGSDNCVGFEYDANEEKCFFIVRTFRFESTDVCVQTNKDTYLRTEIGAKCEALCNVNQLCSAYVFDGDGYGCQLFSDIALLSDDECPTTDSKRLVHIGQTYAERDALVEMTGQCFVDMEDIAQVGCYDVANLCFDDLGLHKVTDDENITPHGCQQKCKILLTPEEEGYDFYAIRGNNECYCAKDQFYLDLETSDTCTEKCKRDTGQTCGGEDAVFVGSTNRPIPHQTLDQCKKKCFESASCEALEFDPQSEECNLVASSDFEECSDPDPDGKRKFIESFEHFYETPTTSYAGNEILRTTTVDRRVKCQRLCDAYLRCESIRYSEEESTNNCEILGGLFVPVEEGEIQENVEAARDVNLFTKAACFQPKVDAKVTEFQNVFGLDECRALCDAAVFCGAFTFGQKKCTLYKATGFADTPTPTGITNCDNNNGSPPYYVDYKTYVDIEQEFLEASGLCVSNADRGKMTERLTSQSKYDCARLCNEMRDCVMFEYGGQQAERCALYNDNANLSEDGCTGRPNAYVMYTLGQFKRTKGEAKLLDEDKRIEFTSKSIFECAALCDEWFYCRSFRMNPVSGNCQLFDSERYIQTIQGDDEVASTARYLDEAGPTDGDLYVYSSDFFYVQMPGNFCVDSASNIGDRDDVILNCPLEACKKICDELEGCISFEHTQQGLCVPYRSNDFSVSCEAKEDRILYISYKDIVDETAEYSYGEIIDCFEDDGLSSEAFKREDCEKYCPGEDCSDPSASCIEAACQGVCSGNEDCFGIQLQLFGGINWVCNILDTDLIKPSGDGSTTPTKACDTTSDKTQKAYVRSLANPYKDLKGTCLQNPIYDNPRDEERIYDTEVFECIALCNAHPLCRYFLHGVDSSNTNVKPRECVLFKSQSAELDDCDKLDCKKDGKDECRFKELTAYVNDRTFTDQITWFGIPDEEFATFGGVSYQECASLCNSLGDDCNAFTHTWNYRRDSTATRPQTFSKIRFMEFSFSGPARFLQIDDSDDSGDLILKTSSNDDDIRRQTLALELAGSKDDESLFLLRFLDGRCVVGPDPDSNPIQSVNNACISKLVSDNFDGAVPFCQQSLKASGACNDAAVFTFSDDRLELSYSFSKDNREYNGCLRARPFDGYEVTTEKSNLNFSTYDCSITREWLETEMPTSPPTLSPTKLPTQSPTRQEETRPPTQSPTMFPTASPTSTKPPTMSPTSPPSWIVQGTYESTAFLQTEPEELERTCPDPPAPCFDTNPKSCSVTTRSYILSQGKKFFDRDNGEVLISSGTEVNRVETICTYINIGPTDPTSLLKSMTDTFNEKCHSTKSMGLLGSSYGPGCGYDGATTFTSQQFAFASDAVILLNDARKRCLSSSLNIEQCNQGSSSKWVHVFGAEGGEIFLAGSDPLECLTRSDNGEGNSVNLEPCKDESSQKWDYDGTASTIVVQGDSSLCLSYQDNELQLGNCIDKEAVWSEYSECRLNTRERTKPMKLEDFDKGNCIGGNLSPPGDALLVPCDKAPMFVYEYGTFGEGDSKLRGSSDDSNICLGRVAPTEESDLQNGPTLFTTCPNPNNPTTLVQLGGEERNVFQFNLPDPKIKTPDYCIQVPSPDQVPKQMTCDSQENPQRWRKFGLSDATEISIRPELDSTTITNPEFLFQAWLYSAEGKGSRVLRSRMAALVREVEVVLPSILAAEALGQEVLNIFTTVSDPVSDVTSTMNSAEDFFSKLKFIIIPFKQLPYIGPILKGAKFEKIFKEVSKLMRKGSDKLETVEGKVGTIETAVSEYLDVLGRIAGALSDGIVVARFAVEYVTRGLFSAYSNDQDVVYRRLKLLVKTINQIISEALSLLAALLEAFSPLNELKALMENNLFSKLREFKDILSGVSIIISKLDFLVQIANFEVCIPLPEFCWWGIVPWFCFEPVCFDLEAIGNFIESIFSFIKSIPGIGYLIEKVEGIVTSLLQPIFTKFVPKFSFDFNLGLEFIDEIKAKLRESLDVFNNVILKFGDLVAVEDIFEPQIREFTDKVLDAAGALKFNPGFNLNAIDLENCDLEDPGSCLPDVGLKVLTDETFPGTEVILPGLEIGDKKYRVTDILPVEQLTELAGKTSSIENMISGIFETDVITCGKYKTISVNVVEIIASTFKLDLTEIGIPNVPYNIQICKSFNFELDALEVIFDKIIDILDPILEGFTSSSPRGRELQTTPTSAPTPPPTKDLTFWEKQDASLCKCNPNWSVSIPLSINSYLLGKTIIEIIKKIFPNVNASLNAFLSKGRTDPKNKFQAFGWKVFWKLYNNEFTLGKLTGLDEKLEETNLIFDIGLLSDAKWSLGIGCTNGRFQMAFTLSPFAKASIGFQSKYSPNDSELYASYLNTKKANRVEAEIGSFAAGQRTIKELQCTSIFYQATELTIRERDNEFNKNCGSIALNRLRVKYEWINSQMDKFKVNNEDKLKKILKSLVTTSISMFPRQTLIRGSDQKKVNGILPLFDFEQAIIRDFYVGFLKPETFKDYIRFLEEVREKSVEFRSRWLYIMEEVDQLCIPTKTKRHLEFGSNMREVCGTESFPDKDLCMKCAGPSEETPLKDAALNLLTKTGVSFKPLVGPGPAGGDDFSISFIIEYISYNPSSGFVTREATLPYSLPSPWPRTRTDSANASRNYAKFLIGAWVKFFIDLGFFRIRSARCTTKPFQGKDITSVIKEASKECPGREKILFRRIKFKLSWSFVGLRLNLRQNTKANGEDKIETNPSIGTVCDGPACWGIGFNPDKFKSFPNLDVIQKGSGPLKECQGDCNGDEDCDFGLVCTKRNVGDDVPGCNGDPDNPNKKVPTPTPTTTSTTTPTPNYCIKAPVDTLVLMDRKTELSSCQGGCSNDDDCNSGLKCFTINSNEEVPGCEGDGISGKGYCYRAQCVA